MDLKNKLIACFIATSIAGGVAVGAGYTGAAIQRAIDDSNTITVDTMGDLIDNLTFTVDRQCPHKVTEITHVEADSTGTKESKTGHVVVYAKAKTAKGTEFSCSFKFTGDAEKAESIDEQAYALYSHSSSELTQSGEQLNKTDIMKDLINYLESINSFVKENKDTCEYVNVTEQSELLTETVSAEDGSTSNVAYTGHSVWNRFFQYANATSDGLSEDTELKELKAKINETIKANNYECQTYIYVDIQGKSATLATELYGTNLSITLNIEQWINEANTTETQKIIDYVKTQALEFLKADNMTANKMILEGIITDTTISSVYSSIIWSCINENILKNDVDASVGV